VAIEVNWLTGHRRLPRGGKPLLTVRRNRLAGAIRPRVSADCSLSRRHGKIRGSGVPKWDRVEKTGGMWVLDQMLTDRMPLG
jgi:hypothetical protein